MNCWDTLATKLATAPISADKKTTSIMAIHTIRLSDHWTRSTAAAGTVTVRRRFGMPRAQPDTQSIIITGEVSASAAIVINHSEAITVPAGQFAIDLTGQLRVNNTIAITMPETGEIQNVTIQIQS
jgi:hypothetical protein